MLAAQSWSVTSPLRIEKVDAIGPFWGGVAGLSCGTPPTPGRGNATECSTTVARDRITVAVQPLGNFREFHGGVEKGGGRRTSRMTRLPKRSFCLVFSGKFSYPHTFCTPPPPYHGLGRDGGFCGRDEPMKARGFQTRGFAISEQDMLRVSGLLD